MNKNQIIWLEKLGLDSSEFIIYGLSEELKNLINKLFEKEDFSINKLAINLNYSPRSIYHWLNGSRPIPIFVLIKILKDAGEFNQSNLIKLQKACTGVAAGSGNNCKKVKLPSEISLDLSYLLGYTFGDGCIKTNEYTIYYVDEYEQQIEVIRNIFKKVFLIDSKKVSKKRETGLLIYSKVIWKFFNICFNFPIGYKKNLRISSALKSNNIRFSFVRGFFDADSGLPRLEERNLRRNEDARIEISQSENGILQDCKQILNKKGINSLGVYYRKETNSYRLIIRGTQNLKKALNLNLYHHPIKAKRLKMLIYPFNINNASVA